MPAVDWAAAWMELARKIAEKPHHGTNDLLAEMTKISANHEVPEDLMQRALRLQGGSFSIHLVPEPGADADDGSPVAAMPLDPRPSHDQKGDHDAQHHPAERDPAAA